MFLRFIRNRIILKVFNLCYVLKSPEMLWKNAGAQSPSLINWLGIQPRLEKVMAPHSSTLAWKIPWTEEPGGLQSIGLWRVRHDWATSLSLFTFMHWSRKWQPTPVFLPGESQGRGSLVGYRLWGRNRVRHDWSDLAVALSQIINQWDVISHLSSNLRNNHQCFAYLNFPP